MNQLRPETIALIEQMTRDSYSGRAIERATSCHRDTIAKYQTAAGLDKINCACGRNIRHRGFCSVRFSRSPARQAWMKSWNPSLTDLGDAINRIDDPCYFGPTIEGSA